MAKTKKFVGFAALVEEHFKDKIQLRTSKGLPKQVPRLEVMVLQQVMQAVKGDKKALKFVLKHLEELPPPRSKSKAMIEFRYEDGGRKILHFGGRTKHIDAEGNVTWVQETNFYPEYHGD